MNRKDIIIISVCMIIHIAGLLLHLTIGSGYHVGVIAGIALATGILYFFGKRQYYRALKKMEKSINDMRRLVNS